MEFSSTPLDIVRVVVIGFGLYLVSILAFKLPKPKFFGGWPRHTFFLTGVALLIFSTLDYYDDHVSRAAEFMIWMGGFGILVLAGILNRRAS